MGAWVGLLGVVTFVLWLVRDRLDETSKTLVLLMVVLAASARNGRVVGMTLAALSFLAFNFFLLPPYYTLQLADPRHWLILFGFLLTGGVAAQLFHRVQEAQSTAERKASEAAALQEADRLKDAFIASVSHDLRTPLTTIRALAAEMREADPERAVVIEEEADRLNRLVADLLDLSRMRAGALPLDMQIVAAEDLVGAALQRLAGVPGSERIRVGLPADGSLPVARMDFVQSLRALCNILENALRHAPTSEPVALEVGVDDAHVVFRVLDRGPGIPELDRERVFEPFYRAHPGGSERPGTGLGLAIARSLAEAQGGFVRCDPREGGGSVFTLGLSAASVPGLG